MFGMNKLKKYITFLHETQQMFFCFVLFCFCFFLFRIRCSSVGNLFYIYAASATSKVVKTQETIKYAVKTLLVTVLMLNSTCHFLDNDDYIHNSHNKYLVQEAYSVMDRTLLQDAIILTITYK